MKRIISFVATVLVALSAQAQTINVHMADGTTQKFDASKVNYIDFTGSTVIPPAERKAINWNPSINGSLSSNGMATCGTIAGKWLADGTENVAVQIGSEVRQYYVNEHRVMFSEAPFTWLDDFSDHADQAVAAWYPYSDVLSIERSVKTDQETDGLDSSDFMYASTTISYQGSGDWVYPIIFYHQVSMLNIIVNIDIPGDTRTVTGIEVLNTRLSGTFAAPSSGSFGTWTTTEGTEGTITPKAVTGGWNAIAIPQTIATGTDFVIITLSDETTKTFAMPSNFTFQPNKVHKLKFNIKEKSISFSAEIHDWVEEDRGDPGTWGGTIIN